MRQLILVCSLFCIYKDKFQHIYRDTKWLIYRYIYIYLYCNFHDHSCFLNPIYRFELMLIWSIYMHGFIPFTCPASQLISISLLSHIILCMRKSSPTQLRCTDCISFENDQKHDAYTQMMFDFAMKSMFPRFTAYIGVYYIYIYIPIIWPIWPIYVYIFFSMDVASFTPMPWFNSLEALVPPKYPNLAPFEVSHQRCQEDYARSETLVRSETLP